MNKMMNTMNKTDENSKGDTFHRAPPKQLQQTLESLVGGEGGINSLLSVHFLPNSKIRPIVNHEALSDNKCER